MEKVLHEAIWRLKIFLHQVLKAEAADKAGGEFDGLGTAGAVAAVRSIRDGDI